MNNNTNTNNTSTSASATVEYHNALVSKIEARTSRNGKTFTTAYIGLCSSTKNEDGTFTRNDPVWVNGVAFGKVASILNRVTLGDSKSVLKRIGGTLTDETGKDGVVRQKFVIRFVGDINFNSKNGNTADAAASTEASEIEDFDCACA